MTASLTRLRLRRLSMMFLFAIAFGTLDRVPRSVLRSLETMGETVGRQDGRSSVTGTAAD